MTGAAALGALVIGARGGARLARTLASVGWAAERVVLDPAARLAAEPLPAGVVRREGVAFEAAATAAPWLLLLEEGEVVSPALAEAIGAALAEPAALAYAVPLEVRGFGATLAPWRAPIRLARRPGARLVLRAGVAPELGTRRAAGALGVPLVAERAATLTEAVLDVEADGAAIAGVLRARGVRARSAGLVLAFLVAAGRLVAARGAGGVRWGRWILGVLAGYRALLAHAKLWELERSAPLR
jgi:hypothetical protein